MRKRSVVLLSGGLDSSVNLASCVQEDEPVLALTAYYGQRSAEREIDAARKICHYYNVSHEVVELRWLGQLGGNALTDFTKEIPISQNLDDVSTTQKTARQVWVPNRNGILINMAAAYAEIRDAEQVIVGFNREEAVAFPDNSTEFLHQVSKSMKFSTLKRISVHSYTDQMDKIGIIRSVVDMKPTFPWDMIWSCYFGGEAPCGQCESCLRFKRAWDRVGESR